MNKRNILLFVLALSLVLASCNLPTSNGGTAGDIAATATSFALTVQAGGVPQGQVALDITGTSTSTPIPLSTATTCSPTVSANTDVNVRTGPGTVYDIVGYVPQGGTAPVDGKSADGTWWYIQFPAGPGGHGWMAGSVTTATCIPQSLAVIAAPPTPTPLPPTKTPTPTATSSLIILPPIIILFGDIQLIDVFLNTSGDVAVRVGVNPVSSLSGNMTYKVWVDGILADTQSMALPAGSIVDYPGVNISGSHTVKVKLDTPNAYAETNEDNNVLEVVLSH